MLIVLLVVTVALGFGLSIISQSITDVQISGQSEEAVRTFNAAEAGIEAGLSSLTLGQNFTLTDFDNINVDYSVASQNYIETTVMENDVLGVGLTGVADTLTINWVVDQENPGTCNPISGGAPAALLISVIDNAGGVQRYALEACDLGSGNDFTAGDSGDLGYLKKYSLDVSLSDRQVKIRPIYNRATIRVTGVSLPVQTYVIDSLAQSTTKESKAIQVSRTVAATPTIFDFVLFSGTNIIK